MKTCLVGLHGSGKSTALAALWYSVTDHSELCRWRLHSNDRPSDSAIWTDLRDRWLSGKPLHRTEHTPNPEELRLKLRDETGDKTLEIHVPDIAGEDFESMYEHGRFPKKHATLLRSAERIVFFIHVKNYDHPVTLTAPSDGQQVEGPGESWTPDKMYPGSKLIAVLRAIRSLCGNMPELTVVLTAWDLVDKGDEPTEVLSQRFPLLTQYLNANFNYQLMGLSSQGCDYGDSDSVDEMEFDNVERISVVSDSRHHDISQIFS